MNFNASVKFARIGFGSKFDGIGKRVSFVFFNFFGSLAVSFAAAFNQRTNLWRWTFFDSRFSVALRRSVASFFASFFFSFSFGFFDSFGTALTSFSYSCFTHSVFLGSCDGCFDFGNSIFFANVKF